MAFQCIFTSLKTDFLKTISMEAPKYHLGQECTPSGTLLLKVIIMQAHIGTRATVTFIREALSKLDTKMRERERERRSGSVRKSFSRKESLSPRLLMALPTILNVNITPSNGCATPLTNAANLPRTMAFHGIPATLVVLTMPRKTQGNLHCCATAIIAEQGEGMSDGDPDGY
jgi:hypothetical protein